MTNLETNLLKVLTRETVHFCSRVVRLFPARSRKCVRPTYGTFINGFVKKALAGTYGSYDKLSEERLACEGSRIRCKSLTKKLELLN